ncbi:MAG TPA: TrkA family potassium uptake protein [Desulfatiglandales bacterium]|nr:TrkA family potassium uptake protein [Desulfatiglandales bacterium]
MKQFAVIGVGNFGKYLAVSLYKKGHEVLVIDKVPHLVNSLRDQVSQAIVADATDRKAMESLGLKDMDTVIVCIGSVLGDSILTTLNMKDIGVKNILAKAITEDHGRILLKVGANEIFFPEKDLAFTIAERLHNPNMLDYMPFMEGYGIIELAPPRSFIGKTLRDLDLINRFGIQVIAVKEIIPERMNMIPKAQFVIKDSDIMILMGPDKALDQLRNE